MGCDIKFYLISACKYAKYLRPKLIEKYGQVNYQRAIQCQNSRLRVPVITKSFQKTSYQKYFHPGYLKIQGPLKKYLKSQYSETEILKEQIQNIFRKQTTQIYDSRNGFLRHQDYLQQIDSFAHQGYRLKISNHFQVENYLKYIQVCIKTCKKHPDCQWVDEYDDIDDAKAIFAKAYQLMTQKKQQKENEKETYLIFERSD